MEKKTRIWVCKKTNINWKKAMIFETILVCIGVSGVSGLNTYIPNTTLLMNHEYLYVGGSGPGNYSTIQGAVDAATPGDTIFVYSGIYNENIIVSKPINLVGENRNITIIDGGGIGDVCYVSSPLVNITGFTIRNGGLNGTPNYDAGIDIRYSDNCNISENIIKDNGHLAIYIINSKKLLISNNYISNSQRGIYLYTCSNNCTISDNIITGNINSGIYSHDSDNLTIMHNSLKNNQYGIRFGANCDNCSIFRNTISDNDLDGIYLESNNNENTIMWNHITNNWYAVRLWNSNNNLINENFFNDTQYWAVSLSQSSNTNQLYHNNFINNLHNAWDESTNMWDSSNPSGGNYWSDYTGIDANQDGIGDIPYYISGGNNQDHYPFMQQNGWFNQAPNKPTITGPVNGKINIEYTYNATTTDLNNDLVYYKWDWDDGNITGWLGPYPSNLLTSASHTWNQEGTYEIRVKAKDTHGLESNWSDPFALIMPKNQISESQQHFNLLRTLTTPNNKDSQYLIQQNKQNRSIKGEAGIDGVPIKGSFEGILYWNNIAEGKIKWYFLTIDIYLILSKSHVVGHAYFCDKGNSVTGTYTIKENITTIYLKIFIFKVCIYYEEFESK